MVGLAAAVLLAGCTGLGAVTSASSPDPTAAAPQPVNPVDVSPVDVSPADPADPVTSAPPTGDASIAPDGGGVGQPSLSIPRLPVGGAGEPTLEDPDLQCAVVNWSAVDPGAGLGLGVGLRVDGYRLDTDHYSVAAGGRCASLGPSCQGFVFGGSARLCAVPVRTVRPQPPGEANTDLLLVGTAQCAQVNTATCTRVVRAVTAAGRTEAIQLQPPSAASTEATPGSAEATPGSDESTAGESGSPEASSPAPEESASEQPSDAPTDAPTDEPSSTSSATS